jgi:hypothetical protein
MIMSYETKRLRRWVAWVGARKEAYECGPRVWIIVAMEALLIYWQEAPERRDEEREILDMIRRLWRMTR